MGLRGAPLVFFADSVQKGIFKSRFPLINLSRKIPKQRLRQGHCFTKLQLTLGMTLSMTGITSCAE